MTAVTSESTYPVTIAFNVPDRIPRWRALFSFIAVIPHFIVLYILMIAAEVCVVVSWFCGVITGRIPEGLTGFVAGVLRYDIRVVTYAYFLRGSYPPFGVSSEFTDPRNDAEVVVDFVPEAKRSRLTIFFRGLLALPQFIVLMILGIVMYVVLIIGFFSVLILGRWPSGVRNFALGYLRWGARVGAYYFLITDKYPPFSMD